MGFPSAKRQLESANDLPCGRHRAEMGRSMLRPYKSLERRERLGRGMNSSDWRRRIDEIDRQLVELLNARSHCALEIGKLKQAAKLPLYQPEREKEVLQNAERANPGPLSNAAIRRLFERIIDEARAAERDAMHTDAAADEEKEL